MYNHKTDWESFREYLDTKLNLKIPLKSQIDIENAVRYLTREIQTAATLNTPVHIYKKKSNNYPLSVRQLVLEKRKFRRRWFQTGNPWDKKLFNNKVKELKKLLAEIKNKTFNSYLTKLSPLAIDDYSLWKCTKNIKQFNKQIPPIKHGSGSWGKMIIGFIC